jgi:hypothetical protein
MRVPASILLAGASKHFYYWCKRGKGLERGHSAEAGAPGTRSLRDGVERMAAPSQYLRITVIVKMLKWCINQAAACRPPWAAFWVAVG